MSTIVENPPIASLPAMITPAALLAMPDGGKFELVDGHLVERNVSGLSSLVAAEVGRRLGNHNEATGSTGWIFDSEMGYQCFPDRPNKVRKPDVSYIPRDRVTLDQLKAGFLRLPPSLAVEVVSPNDLAEDLEIKIREYLSAGVRLIWILYPISRTARVIGSGAATVDLEADDVLRGEDVLPGFECRLADLIPAEAPTAT